MSTSHALRSMFVASAIFGMLAAPTVANAQTRDTQTRSVAPHLTIPVPCSASALVDAVTDANDAGGGTLALAPFCTYTLTAAAGSGANGADGLPPITTAITMAGLGTTITRASTAPAFRIIEVDGSANVPGTAGTLNLVGVTISGGDSPSPSTGGGIANLGGTLNLVRSDVTGNTAGTGGGIYTDNGTANLVLSRVIDNTATSAGGGIYKNSGSVYLIASTVTGNTPDNCAPVNSVPGCTG